MLEMVTGCEDEVINNPNNIPTTAFVVVESDKGYMLLYNKYYEHWRLLADLWKRVNHQKNVLFVSAKKRAIRIFLN